MDVVTKSGVRTHAEGVNVGSGFYAAIDEATKQLISDAVERARQNGRRTVKARDV